MKIRIIAIGRPSKEYKTLIQEYEKRLKLEVIEHKESARDEQILKSLKGYIILLAINGEQITSEELAKIDHEFVTYVIGGPEGLSDEIKNKADKMISFGRITMPHQLARLVLTEQLYRAMTIRKGKKYHK